MTGEGQLLRVRDVVRLTNLAERTVRAMLADGRLEAVRPVGIRVVRIPARAVEQLFGRPHGQESVEPGPGARALQDVEQDRSIDAEDRDSERAIRQGDVDFWRGELAPLQGTARPASERPSQKPASPLTPRQTKVRLNKLTRRRGAPGERPSRLGR